MNGTREGATALAFRLHLKRPSRHIVFHTVGLLSLVLHLPILVVFEGFVFASSWTSLTSLFLDLPSSGPTSLWTFALTSFIGRISIAPGRTIRRVISQLRAASFSRISAFPGVRGVVAKFRLPPPTAPQSCSPQVSSLSVPQRIPIRISGKPIKQT